MSLEAWNFERARLVDQAPAVFELTRYDIDDGRDHDFKELARRGYVFMQVEVRGRGRAGGDQSDYRRTASPGNR